MIFVLLIGVLGVSLVVWYFWKYWPLHLSMIEMLQRIAGLLPIKNPLLHKYPAPTIAGEYFGFRISLEGVPKKAMQGNDKGFRFLATIELPKVFSQRIFLQNERRKTSLKPIAELKLVPTAIPKFDQQFLLLASDEKMAKAVFQPYLCEKILSLTETNWQLDVQGKEAHFEVWQGVLNAPALGELFKVILEGLNALLVTENAT